MISITPMGSNAPVKALALAPDSCDWLANSRYPSVLHVFDRACNLINERKEVLSTVTSQIGNGPFNLVIEKDISFSEHLSLQSPVSISDTQLVIGNLTIDTTDAKLWSPLPNWKVLHARRNQILCNLSFAMPARHEGPDVTKLQIPMALLQSLLYALSVADLPASLVAARQLAGLGIGLTPAGDDFILGAVLATRIIHPPEIAQALAKEITNATAPLTTSLSAAWLNSAGRGEAGSLWHEFFSALTSVNPGRVQQAMGKIFAMGATSGADALSGFFGLVSERASHGRSKFEQFSS